MRSRLPLEAFGYYLALGASRTYAEVARKFGTSLATVNRAARREKWRDQVLEVEARARDAAKARLQVSLEETLDRHLKVTRALLSRGLEGLRAMPISNSRDALRAIDVALRHEREILGATTRE